MNDDRHALWAASLVAIWVGTALLVWLTKVLIRNADLNHENAELREMLNYQQGDDEDNAVDP
jgi:hypothetical protein